MIDFRLHLDRLRAHLFKNTILERDGLRFWCPNPTCAWRVHTLRTKEPETLMWIDTMQPGETLWDVGANIGLYSLYAASRGLWVVAFEPHAENYSILVCNRRLNPRFVHSLWPFPVALGRTTGLSTLMVNHKSKDQIVQVYAGHDFGMQFPVSMPHHIKLDTDGTELEILEGFNKALYRCRTIQVEIDGAAQVSIMHQYLRDRGFTCEGMRQSRMVRESKNHSHYWNALYMRK